MSQPSPIEASNTGEVLGQHGGLQNRKRGFDSHLRSHHRRRLRNAMSAKIDRRKVMIGAASVAAGAVLPVTSVAAVLPVAAASVPVQPVAALPGAPDLGFPVSGCGAACDCDYYERLFCAAGRRYVYKSKSGDGFVVCDLDSGVIRDADPGYRMSTSDAVRLHPVSPRRRGARVEVYPCETVYWTEDDLDRIARSRRRWQWRYQRRRETPGRGDALGPR